MGCEMSLLGDHRLLAHREVDKSRRQTTEQDLGKQHFILQRSCRNSIALAGRSLQPVHGHIVTAALDPGEKKGKCNRNTA